MFKESIIINLFRNIYSLIEDHYIILVKRAKIIFSIITCYLLKEDHSFSERIINILLSEEIQAEIDAEQEENNKLLEEAGLDTDRLWEK